MYNYCKTDASSDVCSSNSNTRDVAIGALLDIPALPLWSVCVFALSLWIIHGLIVYGEDTTAARG